MSEPQEVYTRDGHRGFIVAEGDASRDDVRFVRVAMDDGLELHVPAELLELRPDGAFNLNVGYADVMLGDNANVADTRGVRIAAPRQAERGAATARAVGAADAEHIVVPVIAEELRVDRRTVTTGVVRVHKRVSEREELIEEAVTREDVQVERVSVGQMVADTPRMRTEGDTLIIPVVEEVLVVEKRLLLKEEVRVTWRRETESAPQRVILRGEEVIVERVAPGEATDGTASEQVRDRPGPSL